MSRPRKEKSEERGNRITFRLTDQELDNLKSKSRKSKISISDFVREQIKNGKVVISKNNKSELAKASTLTEEFHKIGINLNQIAHHLNSGYDFTEPIANDLISRADDLRELTNRINELLEK